ncbi:MAG: radical SAM protein [Gammaproteobacteria bacterium]|nr:radical SAM protein [Gammaproteobacteria bacterium]
MRILCIIPPYLPSYFNAGHHLPVFQVGAFLRKHLPQAEITCLDCAALNITWKEVCDILTKGFDVIAVLNDFDAIDTFSRFQYYQRLLAPSAKTITFGRLSKQIPRFFFQFHFNAVVASGDYEIGVLNYIKYLRGDITELPGVLLSKESSHLLGTYLDPEEWVLPNINDIPYMAYHYMYKNDLNKFCGIPERMELVVPLARGCPVNCLYCDVPPMQGKIERRLSVTRTIDYIQNSFATLPFEYVSFYAPTFTLNKPWVKELCSKLIELPKRYFWKCVTVLKTLDEEIISLMSESHCVRISLGIESFTNAAAIGLPNVKQNTLDTFKTMARLCQKYNIELNCFIMLGMPGDTPQDAQHTIDVCLEYGARVRPAIYTPYQNMRENMLPEEISYYNRQLFPPNFLPADIAAQYYDIFYNNRKDKKTTIMEKIIPAAAC